MKKVLTLLALVAFLTGTAMGQPEAPQKKGLNFTNPFSAVENFVEQAEVSLAGIIGGKDLKAKALANNAEEDLERAERLSSMNRSDKAAKLIERYEEKMNKSRELAQQGRDRNLSSKIENISSRNVQRLEEVKKKAPKEAQKGIQNAIENSQRKGDIGRPGDKSTNGSKGNKASEEHKPRKKINESVDKPNFSEKAQEKLENTSNKSKGSIEALESEAAKAPYEESAESGEKELNLTPESKDSQDNGKPRDIKNSGARSLQ